VAVAELSPDMTSSTALLAAFSVFLNFTDGSRR
jgi:hypothetical protein